MANDSTAFRQITALANTPVIIFTADGGPRIRQARNMSGATIYLGSTNAVDATGYPVKDGETLGDSLGHDAVWAVCPTAALDVRRITVQ